MSANRSIKDQLWDESGGKCWYCGIAMRQSTNTYDPGTINDLFTVDHIVPLCAGGSDEIENLRASCKSCNSTKRGMSVPDFRRHLARKSLGVPRFSRKQMEFLARTYGVNQKHIDHIIDSEASNIVFWGERS